MVAGGGVRSIQLSMFRPLVFSLPSNDMNRLFPLVRRGSHS